MEKNFNKYRLDVLNRMDEFTYTEETVWLNQKYFRRCMEEGLSAYKALLFLHDYLNKDGNEGFRGLVSNKKSDWYKDAIRRNRWHWFNRLTLKLRIKFYRLKRKLKS